MGGWPKDADAKKAIKALEKDFAWVYDTEVGKSAHKVGTLICGQGCKVSVNGTARNTARALWKLARKCSHGKGPDRPQW